MAIEKRNVYYDAFQLYLDGTHLTMVKQMKYLGALLDTKFSWKQLLSYISEKCDKLQRGLNRIARNTFSINFKVHSLIYKQGFEPFMLYDSRVWGEALKRKMNSKYLRHIQRRILLRVTCGYHTLSYNSVYATFGVPPIDITILHNIAFRENLCASSISNYDCILSPFFSLILQRGVSSILFNLVTRAQMISLLFAILMAEKLKFFAVKWITEQNKSSATKTVHSSRILNWKFSDSTPLLNTTNAKPTLPSILLLSVSQITGKSSVLLTLN
ncbi:uncharacterized protein TNCV_4040291 [Trichonephila clavipes]|nr:uncharacterized protein TNCV_4040291 [Trichonephila clavipes]